MPLSEHVHCVAVAFKMTEQVEQWICIKFCIKLEHSSAETIWMIQQVAAVDTWWLAALYCNMPTYASHLMQNFLAKHQISQVTQPLYSPDLVPYGFWLFPKLKSPLKVKRFQAVDEIQENTKARLIVTGRTVRPQGVCFEGDWGFIGLCTVFLEFVSF